MIKQCDRTSDPDTIESKLLLLAKSIKRQVGDETFENALFMSKLTPTKLKPSKYEITH